jgi:site-specific DNA-methyltransferase (adenine-specific)
VSAGPWEGGDPGCEHAHAVTHTEPPLLVLRSCPCGAIVRSPRALPDLPPPLDPGDVERWHVECGDCVEVLERMPAESIDAVVTDPPYGISFMNTGWDKPTGTEWGYLPGSGVRSSLGESRAFQASVERWARACLRVLKPGGFLLAFGGTRTYHRLACGVEDAGFEIRDRVLTLNGDVGAEVDWVYGSGWPKSRNIGKAIDAAAGAEREVVGYGRAHPGALGRMNDDAWEPREGPTPITAPATTEAEQWEGWGTALKPAHEPIAVARKPFRGTVEAQVLATGTGALNIDACRIKTGGEQLKHDGSDPARRRGIVGAELQANGDAERNAAAQAESIERANRMGRWPANVALVHAPGCELVGQRRVPTGVSVRRNIPEGARDGGIFNKASQRGEDFTYAEADGLETIEAWRCEIGCPVALLDDLSGDAGASAQVMGTEPALQDGSSANAYGASAGREGRASPFYADAGGASRFFYSGKASPLEREAGLDGLPIAGRTDDAQWVGMQTPKLDRACPRENWQPREVRNRHPTVKPIDLMGWLVRLVTQPGGVVLDPFAGSGSTGCAAVLAGMRFVGIEQDDAHAAVARARIAFWAGFPVGTPVARVLAQEVARRRAADEATERRRDLAHAGQLDLLASSEVDPHG